MQGQWRTQSNSTFSIVVLLVYNAFASFFSPSAVAAPPITLQQVHFGKDGLTAGLAVDITALFRTDNNQTQLDGALGEVQLVALSSDLQWLHIHPQQSAAAAGDNGTYALVFDKVNFPTGGQYALIFDGQLPDETGKAQAVSISTLVGVAGDPTNVHAPYQREADARVGITDVVVHSIASTVRQQRSVSLAELVSYPTVGQVAGSTAVHANSSSAADSNQALAQPVEPQRQYRIILHTQGACTPGHATTYNWTFTDASTGAPVTDLQGSGGVDGLMPLVIVNSNLSFALHTSAGSMPGNGGKRSTSISSSSSDAHRNIVEEQAALLTNSNTAPGGVVSSSTAGIANAPQQQPGARRMLQLLSASEQRRQLLQSNNSSSSSSSSGENSSTFFGPTVSAEVELPEYGTYLFLGEVTRDDDMIVVPFVVSCEPMQAAPALPVAAAISAGFAIGANPASYTWIATLAIAICLQQLLL